MSTRVEWVNMDHPFLRLAAHATGSQIGEDAVTSEAAISISADELTVIEGTIEQLRSFGERWLKQVANIEKYYADKTEKEKADD